MTDKELGRARKAFLSLAREEQFELVAEIVVARAAEFHRAYPDLLGMTFGFKSRRDKAGRERLVRTPCVVFEVARKRALKRASESARRLPELLLAHAGPRGERVLCAVPTDVRASSAYGKPRAHAGSAGPLGAIVAGSPYSPRGAAGAIACVVTSPSAPGRAFGVSCRHVLSRSLVESPDVASGRRVTLGAINGRGIGVTTVTRGPLVSAPAPSFDAQLLEVQDTAGIQGAMFEVLFDENDSIVTAAQFMPNTFWVAPPRLYGQRRVKLQVDLIDFPQMRPMPYDLPSGTVQVAHRMLIHGRMRQGTLDEGDSGAPALLDDAGTALVGMYLGGDGYDVYFLPAWNLLSGPAGSQMRIVNP